MEKENNGLKNDETSQKGQEDQKKPFLATGRLLPCNQKDLEEYFRELLVLVI